MPHNLKPMQPDVVALHLAVMVATWHQDEPCLP